MQRGRTLDQPDLVRGEPELGRDEPRHPPHPSGVLAGLVIPVLRRKGQALERLDLGLLGITRALPHAGLEVVVLLLQLQVEPARVEHVADPQQHLFGVEGLREEVVRPAGQCLALGVLRDVGREDEHGQVRTRRDQHPEKLQDPEPVEPGHVQVEQDEVRLVAGQDLGDRAGVGDRLEPPVAAPGQDPLEQPNVRLLVVDDQDPRIEEGAGVEHVAAREERALAGFHGERIVQGHRGNAPTPFHMEFHRQATDLPEGAAHGLRSMDVDRCR